METLLVERSEGVVTVTFNRPEKKNAISGAMWAELRATVDEIANRTEDRVVVITGAGDAFCAGQDLTDPANAARIVDEAACLEFMRDVGTIALALHECPKPTIAAVNGVAAGAGANLALGCDLILAGESARFSQIFAARGLSVDFGGSWVLPRLIGLHKAKELAFFADIISAADARELGLVNRVVPNADLLGVANEWARRLAAGPPLALAAIKRSLNRGVNATMADVLEAEALAQTELFLTKDAAEAFHAFAEKRAPTFTGE
jgi:2-(1,2-epoxy-1,2-dihydrophenyl)acetyl-CoA isomerase